jgi:hypothetical protein
VLLTVAGKEDPCVAACLMKGKEASANFTLSKTIVKEILSNKKAVVIGDPTSDPRFAGQQYGPA